MPIMLLGGARVLLQIFNFILRVILVDDLKHPA
jgi:hypothetical protein